VLLDILGAVKDGMGTRDIEKSVVLAAVKKAVCDI
jgi:hypothetical protein